MSRVAQIFTEMDKVDDALREYAQDQLSAEGLLARLAYCKDKAHARAEREAEIESENARYRDGDDVRSEARDSA